jgi:hypothetical protein
MGATPQQLEEGSESLEAGRRPTPEESAVVARPPEALCRVGRRPPALPLPLVRVQRRGDAWIDQLPEPSRRALEAARRGAVGCPVTAPRDGSARS